MLTLSSNTVQPPENTRNSLLAAEGYVFLGLYHEALKEINDVPEQEQDGCDVMIAHVRVLLHLHRWRKAARLSAKGQALHQNEDEFPVQRAFALRQRNMDEAAARVLRDVPEWIRRTGILHYNLACYEARWGNLDVARQRLQEALQINSEVKEKAKEDPDLSDLW